MKKVTYFELDYNELEAILEAQYGMRRGSCELVAQEEWNNYSNYTFEVKAEQLTPEDTEAVKKAVARTLEPPEHKWGFGKCFDPEWVNTGQLMNDMCFHGKLEAGDYLVTVFW